MRKYELRGDPQQSGPSVVKGDFPELGQKER